MKKKLEAELMSIAHRILKLKGRDDVAKLHFEAQKVTEALAILKFYEDHVALVSKEISEENFNQELDSLFNNSKYNQPKASVPSNNLASEVPSMEDTVEASDPKIIESEATKTPEIQYDSLKVDLQKNNIPKISNKKTVAKQISLEDFLVHDYEAPEFIKLEHVAQAFEQATDVVFEKANESSSEIEIETITEITETITKIEDEVKHTQTTKATQEDPTYNSLEDKNKEITSEESLKVDFVDINKSVFEESQIIKEETNTVLDDSQVIELSKSFKASETIAEKGAHKILSLNDRLTKGISIGLNDRIAFVKNLFGGSNEDYNRVMSQLNTIDNYSESISFIEDMVKPDYNQWIGNDEYAERFMLAIEKKFL